MPELIRADQVAGPLIAVRRGVDMDSTSDQPITCTPRKYIIRRVVFANASISLTTAAGGIYTGLGKTGTAIVPAAQSYSTLTAASRFVDTTLDASTSTDTFTNTVLYLSLTTPQGAPATADIYIYGDAVEP